MRSDAEIAAVVGCAACLSGSGAGCCAVSMTGIETANAPRMTCLLVMGSVLRERVSQGANECHRDERSEERSCARIL